MRAVLRAPRWSSWTSFLFRLVLLCQAKNNPSPTGTSLYVLFGKKVIQPDGFPTPRRPALFSSVLRFPADVRHAYLMRAIVVPEGISERLGPAKHPSGRGLQYSRAIVPESRPASFRCRTGLNSILAGLILRPPCAGAARARFKQSCMAGLRLVSSSTFMFMLPHPELQPYATLEALCASGRLAADFKGPTART